MEDRLRKFAKVVEASGFARAASELHISQPALSTAVRKLERELDVELFSRRKPPLKLTRAGKTAYRYSKELDSRANNFKSELARLSHQKPKVSIGMIDSIADTLFLYGDYMPQLRKKAELSLSVNNSRVLARALEKGELDIVLVAQPQSASPMLHAVPLGSEPLVAVAAPGHLEEARRSLQAGRLPKFLSYDKKSNTDHLIHQYFLSRGIETDTIFYSTSPEILLRMVLSGEGVAVLPYLLIRDAIKHNSLLPVAGPIARPIISLEHKDRTSPKALVTLQKHVQQLLTNLSTEADQLFSGRK